MVAYQGKYEEEFVLDNKGVLCRTKAKQAKRNRVINTLTVMLGLLTGRPSVAGAGLLAQSRQEVFIQWSRVTKVKYKPHSHTIFTSRQFFGTCSTVLHRGQLHADRRLC